MGGRVGRYIDDIIVVVTAVKRAGDILARLNPMGRHEVVIGLVGVIAGCRPTYTLHTGPVRTVDVCKAIDALSFGTASALFAVRVGSALNAAKVVAALPFAAVHIP